MKSFRLQKSGPKLGWKYYFTIRDSKGNLRWGIIAIYAIYILALIIQVWRGLS